MTTLHMPIIAPPPPGTTAAAHYNAITTRIRASRVEHDGLKITLTNLSSPTHSQLFAMAGGLLRFIQPGRPLVAGRTETAPVGGALVLQIGPNDYGLIRSTQNPRLPRMAYAVYLGVRPDSVRPALTAQLANVLQFTPNDLLLRVWRQTHSSDTSDRDALANNWLDSVVRGERDLFVPPGALIGEAGQAPSGGVEFTLRFIGSRAGASGAAGVDVSPVLHIRNMPVHGDGGAACWNGHPLIRVVSDIPEPVNIYARFEVWNASSHDYVPLPQGVRVSLKDYDVLGNEELGVQTTDGEGRVYFHYPNLSALEALDETRPDIFFLVHTNNMRHAGHTLPREWSTKGWRDKYGNPGYFEEYNGEQLGNEDSPLVYRIGLDLHVKLEYTDLNDSITPAPKGIDLRLGRGAALYTSRFRTDQNGELHTVVFDIDAGSSLYFEIYISIEDPSIHLPQSSVFAFTTDGSCISWETNTGRDQRHYPDWDRTSIGSYSSPESIRSSVPGRGAAFYLLKILREWSTFLFHVTGGAWRGVQNLRLFQTSGSGHAYSWPVGEVNIPPDSEVCKALGKRGINIPQYWCRGTIIHELSHQIMWQELASNSWIILYQASPLGNLYLYHQENLLKNTEHALIEGWAEFMEAIFAGTSYSVNPVTTDGNNQLPLGPPPNNRGESVEGAFANSLLDIFRNHVLPSGSTVTYVPESTNGDITSGVNRVPWLQDAVVRNNFLELVWHPLQDLRSLSPKTTTAMLIAIRNRNLARWHLLLTDLQRYNLQTEIPHITGISPSNGPTGGGQTVVLTGTYFSSTSSVEIGGRLASSITVNSSTSITIITPPNAAGQVDVIVRTGADGSGTLHNGYTYS